MPVKFENIPPPVVAVLSLAAGAGLHFSLPEAWRNGCACRPGAIGLCGLALAVVAWAWLFFRLSSTPVWPWRRATSLVTGGPYRVSRNPMYLGVALALAAVALWTGSWPMLMAPLFFLGFMSLVRIPHEERQLRAIFGAAYLEYTSKVRRWI